MLTCNSARLHNMENGVEFEYCGAENKDLREEFTAGEPEVEGGQLCGQLQLSLALVCTGSQQALVLDQKI
jgi:hypothetical protein